ncbi:MAG TPA: O-antigen ligase family protein [Halomonas sp.]|nr:O-antigen ligase family protein [Halomonas sp.]HEB06466.1 O-antigen ligase family protein [Halomonas sp.]
MLMRNYASLSVFLMGSIALVVPTGYSVGPLLLLFASTCLLFRKETVKLTTQDILIIIILATYALVVGGMSYIEIGSRGLDRPVRFLLAIPVLLLILRYPPHLAWLWSGLALGAGLAGGWAAWQKFVEGVWRAEGYTHVIQFGNLSMLMGVICFAGIGWALSQPRFRFAWCSLLAVGGLMGMLASLLSGSRGGWVGLPVVAFVLYKSYGHKLSKSVKALVIAGLVLAGLSLYSIPQTGLQDRFQDAKNDISSYYSDENRDTSLGLRFEMWRGASQLIMERPILGWGEAGYAEAMIELGEQGEITYQSSQFGHAHNEFIDALAKRGLMGLAVLLALYFVPLRLFASGLKHQNLETRSLAVAGTLLAVGYIDFGLSQAFLAHNSGVMFYAFWLSLLWGCYRVQLIQQQISVQPQN